MAKIGETNVMQCGLTATIINIHGYDTKKRQTIIDVRFEDGLVIENRIYTHFRKGLIAHPDYNTKTINARKERLGMTIKQNIGLNGTIVEYRNASDIDVLLEDGRLLQHRQWDEFRKGLVSGLRHRK